MDTSPLDYIAHSCTELTQVFRQKQTTDAEKENILNDHIRKVWQNESPIIDFKKHLEWVNVLKPLSLVQHCSSKIVVLDFWTYCCINCYHVLPDLAHLEKLFSIEDGVVVIGVHCAKFDNEKKLTNIQAAVERYGITHPVVNDPTSSMWEALGMKCWPTLLILGPGNKPLFVLVGEGHRATLEMYVRAAMAYFEIELAHTKLPVSMKSYVAAREDNVLWYPSKLALNPFYRGRPEEPYIVISDTGHHRLVLADCSGTILKLVGGVEPGFKDGNFTDAMFDSPQGVCWLASNVVAVCDPGNHAVRTVHLDEGTVDTLAGNGEKTAMWDLGGKCLGLQSLSSPWDLVLFVTPDMDMTIRAPMVPTVPIVPTAPSIPTAPNVPTAPPPPPGAPPPPPGAPLPPTLPGTNEQNSTESADRRVLLVACAGSHQVWAVFLDTTIWWEYKKYAEGTCVCVAGSGVEAALNSNYPAAAAFAQPSGLALHTGTNPELIIADSESSSVRRLSLSTGAVSTLAGGDKNPLNLFAFGDVDDVGMDAKFQHPLAVAHCSSSRTVYLADTYNHRIKTISAIHPAHKVATLHPNLIETTEPATFNEPSGLAITPDGKYLYIADTNNHCIKLLNIAKNVCQEFQVQHPELKFREPKNLIIYNNIFVNRKCGRLIIYFGVTLENAESKFTDGAPQHWSVCVRDEASKDVTREVFEFVNSSSRGSRLPGRIELRLREKTDKTHYRLYLSFQTAFCNNNVCFSHSFTVRCTMLIRDSVKPVESYRITCKVNPINHATLIN